MYQFSNLIVELDKFFDLTRRLQLGSTTYVTNSSPTKMCNVIIILYLLIIIIKMLYQFIFPDKMSGFQFIYYWWAIMLFRRITNGNEAKSFY